MVKVPDISHCLATSLTITYGTILSTWEDDKGGGGKTI